MNRNRAFKICSKQENAFALFKHAKTGALLILPSKDRVREFLGHVPTRLPYKGLTLVLSGVSYENAIWFAQGLNHSKSKQERTPWLHEVIERFNRENRGVS